MSNFKKRNLRKTFFDSGWGSIVVWFLVDVPDGENIKYCLETKNIKYNKKMEKRDKGNMRRHGKNMLNESSAH